jgi:serine/threonine protein kinase
MAREFRIGVSTTWWRHCTRASLAVDDRTVVVEGQLGPGVIVAKNYRVIRPLAAGGFGTVYLGENTTIEQRVVIKVLRAAERGAGAEEARMLAALDHPNVVHVYAYDDAHDCIVMQHLAGETLHAQQHRLDLVTSVRVVYEIALALRAVHDRGLVHRDVKPENIMIGPDRAWAKLIDMGTALRIGRTLKHSAGTAEYCPPEQFDGSVPASPSNDIYALGVTLFSLCTRMLPFHGTPEELARAHLTAPVPDVVEVVDSLREAESRARQHALEPARPQGGFLASEGGRAGLRDDVEVDARPP